MWRLTLVLALAACGSRGDDAPPKPAPRDAGVTVAPGVRAPGAPPFEVAAPADKLVAVGRSERHACVVRASGAVDCWGAIAGCPACELGAPPDASVRRVPGLTDAVAVSADGRCFVRRTGEATCFTGAGLDLKPVAGIVGAVASDGRGSCFVDGKGGVICDGSDKAWKVPGLADVIALASNELATCAVRRSGTLSCGTQFSDHPWKPVRGIDKVSELAMAGRMDSYACVMRVGVLRCFELSPYGDGTIVVDPDSKEHPLAPHVAAKFANAKQLVMYVVDNRIYLQGMVGGRVVATDFEDVWDVPVLADAAVLARQCAIRTQGALVCWGPNDGGALAQPTTLMNAQVAPVTVVGLSDVDDIAVGLSRSYALTRDGRVWWWGRVWDGISIARSATPAVLPLGLGPEKIVQITANRANNVCMRGASGEVWCQVDYLESRIEQLDTDGVRDMSAYGNDVVLYRTGALPEVHGIGGEDRYGGAAMDITELLVPDAAEHAAAGDFTCARRGDGTVWCPRPIAGISSATQLVASGAFGCVVQRGRVWCWLDEHMYQRGPLSQIAGVRDATDIAASPEGACAVHDGGRLSCWTYDEQPAGGEKMHRTWKPPVVVIERGVADVELGQGWREQYKRSFNLHGPEMAGAYGCARMVDRTVQCWGMNVFGELGDGSLLDTKTPIGVTL